MDKVSGRLTVFFEDSFWVGVFERIENGKLSAAKVTFGAEPKDCEILEYIQKYYYSLRFSPAVAAAVKEKKRNPKRMQRDIRKYVEDKGLGTKAQRALKLWHEQEKAGRKAYAKKLREEEKERKFELHRKKKKEKHRGF